MAFSSEGEEDRFYHYSSSSESKKGESTTIKKAPKSGWGLAAGYLLAWVIILVIFRHVYQRYRQTSSKKLVDILTMLYSIY